MAFQAACLALLLRRMDDSGGGGLGCFVALMVIGIVVFLVLRGRRDRAEQLAAAKPPMPSGRVQGHTFPNPYPRCPSCGASGDKMEQAWDGLRTVTWTCGYCGSRVGVQELKDEELPPGARHRLGLAEPGEDLGPGAYRDFPPQGGGSGMGGLLTGMMLGEMLSHGRDGRTPMGDDGFRDAGGSSDWGDGGGDPGGDWGDSGDSGGGDAGGGDSGGGDWGDSGGNDF